MKYIFLFALQFNCATLLSQNLEKDTLLLSEVTVTEKVKPKVKKFKYHSSCTFHEHLNNKKEIITLLNELPEGYLESIKFYFNNYMPTQEKLYDLKDKEVELVFYEVNLDNTPGKLYHTPTKKIIVPREQIGSMEIDLSNLNIYYPGKLFIGLRILNEVDGQIREIEVDGICNKNDKYISYFKSNLNTWERHQRLSALKMEVKVAVPK